jgi:hypothetical protein
MDGIHDVFRRQHVVIGHLRALAEEDRVATGGQGGLPAQTLAWRQGYRENQRREALSVIRREITRDGADRR